MMQDQRCLCCGTWFRLVPVAGGENKEADLNVMPSTTAKLETIYKAAQEFGDWFTVPQLVRSDATKQLGLDEQTYKRHLKKLCEAGLMDFKPGRAPRPHLFKAI